MVEIAWFACALLGGLCAARFGLPVFVGYLLAGIALGLAGQTPSELVLGAGEVGVLLLLFGVGLHIRPRTLISRPVWLGGLAHLAISLALFFTLAAWAGFELRQALLWGTLLGFSSTVLAAKMLEARGDLGAFHGRVAIAILILQDIVAVGVMVVVAGQAPSPWSLALIPGALAVRWLLPRVLTDELPEELLLLVAAFLAIGGAMLFEQLHLGAELGAVAAGALAAGHGDGLARRLWGLKEFLLVGFFLSVGMRVSPAEVEWGYVALFTLLLPFKAWLFFSLLVWLGLRARTAFLTGVSLTSYSEFALIAGAVALEHGLLAPSGMAVLAMTTVASFAIHMPVNRLSQALYDRFQGSLRNFERDGPHPDDPSPSIGSAQYLVLGMGRTGTAAYDYLRNRQARPVGMDTDLDVLGGHLREGRRVAYGDTQDEQLWHSLDLDALQGAVVALPSAETRLRATRLLHRHAPRAVISTFALYDTEAETLRAAGASNVSWLLAEAGERMAELSVRERAEETVPRPG